MSRLGSILIALLAVLFAAALPAAAQTLASPKGDPILEVTGQIGVTNSGKAAVFDRDMLEAIGLEKITTATPWHSGTVTFEGVRLSRLMELVGARGKSVRAVALNDYAATVPMEDFSRFPVILAMKRDGQYMPVRDKGPLFIIYPYDSNPDLKAQMYYARSVWQIKRLEIQD
jgi:hypothetical protein